MNPKDIERFMSKIEQTDNCWLWTAGHDRDGYGFFQLNGKYTRAHRVSYELFKGFIPDGLVLDHLCRNRDCVNPEHLEAVTVKENIQRGETGTSKNTGSFNRDKTHCKHGHGFTPENTSVYQNHRYCKKCDKIRIKVRRNL